MKCCSLYSRVSWSVLSHVLSEEQSKDGSDRVSDDGRLTIVQCHHYHRPPSSEYFLHSTTTNTTCILIIVITNQYHVLSTAAQPEPHHAPHTFHVPGQSHHACTSSRGHESRSPQGPVRIYVGILWHHSEYESPCYMFILLPYALHNNSLYVYVLLQYKYSSLLYVFR